eukprot:gnl/TRDRNA2_/TRDRNA2_125610_c0_seq1.p1 gnl/TRDRNA2_/TRDRNA2_125610_c0~~gnl/TRDRNA2_/TRDRNA2_125610_c0_seq1.p1  ORF type:complete len:479 (+),score=47.21 gnl/TRDRNA2_/TRDRNA2_125610_c0_seq1:23-1459(+)
MNAAGPAHRVAGVLRGNNSTECKAIPPGSRVEARYQEEWYIGTVIAGPEDDKDGKGRYQVQCDVDESGMLTITATVKLIAEEDRGLQSLVAENGALKQILKATDKKLKEAEANFQAERERRIALEKNAGLAQDTKTTDTAKKEGNVPPPKTTPRPPPGPPPQKAKGKGKATLPKDDLKPLKINQRVAFNWSHPNTGELVHWPGKIKKRSNFVRCRIVDDKGTIEPVDVWDDKVVNLAEPKVLFSKKVQDDEFEHTVKFETSTTIHSWSLISTKEKSKGDEITIEVGEDLTEGLPFFYSVEMDGDAGTLHEQERHMIHPIECVIPKLPLSHDWPETKIFEENPPNNFSQDPNHGSIVVINNYPKNSGRAMFVKICKAEDRDEKNPKAIARLFLRPSEGEKIPCPLPKASYHLRYASGHDWKGERNGKCAWFDVHYLFGPGGEYAISDNLVHVKTSTIHTYTYPVDNGGCSVSKVNQDVF